MLGSGTNSVTAIVLAKEVKAVAIISLGWLGKIIT